MSWVCPVYLTLDVIPFYRADHQWFSPGTPASCTLCVCVFICVLCLIDEGTFDVYLKKKVCSCSCIYLYMYMCKYILTQADARESAL